MGMSGVAGGSKEDNSANSSNSSSNTDTNDDTSKVETDDQLASIGQTVSDGKFSFVVTKVKCGIASVGSDLLGQEAQGQYCRVSVTVANTGDEPQTMFSDNQLVYDTQGRKFSADSTANLYAGDAGDVWLNEINPGNSVQGDLYFDVPTNIDLDYIELHDSMFSGGVKVSLK